MEEEEVEMTTKASMAEIKKQQSDLHGPHAISASKVIHDSTLPDYVSHMANDSIGKKNGKHIRTEISKLINGITEHQHMSGSAR